MGTSGSAMTSFLHLLPAKPYRLEPIRRTPSLDSPVYLTGTRKAYIGPGAEAGDCEGWVNRKPAWAAARASASRSSDIRQLIELMRYSLQLYNAQDIA